MKEQKITITPEGEIKIEAEGYTGGDCLKDLEKYIKFMKEHGVDLEVKDQKKKPAFYMTKTDSSIQVGSK